MFWLRQQNICLFCKQSNDFCWFNKILVASTKLVLFLHQKFCLKNQNIQLLCNQQYFFFDLTKFCLFHPKNTKETLWLGQKNIWLPQVGWINKIFHYSLVSNNLIQLNFLFQSGITVFPEFRTRGEWIPTF